MPVKLRSPFYLPARFGQLDIIIRKFTLRNTASDCTKRPMFILKDFRTLMNAHQSPGVNVSIKFVQISSIDSGQKNKLPLIHFRPYLTYKRVYTYNIMRLYDYTVHHLRIVFHKSKKGKSDNLRRSHSYSS